MDEVAILEKLEKVASIMRKGGLQFRYQLSLKWWQWDG